MVINRLLTTLHSSPLRTSHIFRTMSTTNGKLKAWGNLDDVLKQPNTEQAKYLNTDTPQAPFIAPPHTSTTGSIRKVKTAP